IPIERDSSCPSARLKGRLTTLLCAVAFFSGFPALLYLFAWQRVLMRILGGSSAAMTSADTILMLGLGIGCLGGGWLASRRIPLAPLLALPAAASSALGFFSLALFERLGDLVAGLSPAAATALTLAPALLPSTMMGAALPLLVGHLAQRSNSVGAAA